jgi:hypothetical protein
MVHFIEQQRKNLVHDETLLQLAFDFLAHISFFGTIKPLSLSITSRVSDMMQFFYVVNPFEPRLWKIEEGERRD